MRRREFIGFLGGIAAWPIAGLAQQQPIPVIGFLGSASAGQWDARLNAFRQGLKEAGYVEGQSVKIEYCFADGKYDRLPALAAGLVGKKVTAIAAAANSPAALAAKAATTSIPVVFVLGSDPVEIGLVPSLNRPGGNLTGVTVLTKELSAKRLELLHELVPPASSIGVVVNRANLNSVTGIELQAAAKSLGRQIHVLEVNTEPELEAAFETLSGLRAGGVVVGAEAFFSSRSEKLAALTAHYALPAIYQFRDFAAAGGLMSYGSNNLDAWRHAGVTMGRVLKGENAGDLPVEQSDKVELVLNLKTAKALGITVPLSLLGRADEIIE